MKKYFVRITVDCVVEAYNEEDAQDQAIESAQWGFDEYEGSRIQYVGEVEE